MGKIFNAFLKGMKSATGQAELANFHMNFDRYNQLYDLGRSGIAKGNAAQELAVYSDGTASWVNIALNRKMLDVANVEYFFVDKDDKRLELSEVQEELRLPFTSGYAGIGFHELFSMAIGHEDLTGNALWVKNSNTNLYAQLTGRVDEFIPIVPGMFKINADSRKTKILSYTVRWADGSESTYQPDQVVHFKRNPLICPLYGVGLISQGRMAVDYAAVAADYQITFMEKDGTPDLVYIDKNPSNPDDISVRAKQLREEYKAGKMSHSLLYAHGDVDIKAFSISAADLQYVENKKLNDEQILALMESTGAALGIPNAQNVASSGDLLNSYFDIVNSRIDHGLELLNKQHFLKVKGNETKKIRLSFTQYATGSISAVKDAVNNGLMTPANGAKVLGYPVKPEKDDPASHVLYLSRTVGTMQSVFETEPLSFGGLSDGTITVKKKTMIRDYPKLSTSENADQSSGSN